MRAILSNKIYLDRPVDIQADYIEKQLTYRIVPAKAQTFKINGRVVSKTETIRTFTRVSSKVLAIPIGRTDLIPEGYEIVDKRINEKIDWPTPSIPLNEFQQPVYDEFNESAMINAGVGFGKTFTALHLAHKLGLKTLVVVHTLALRDQWINEIERMFGIKAGVIGAGMDKTDSPIVVSNIQTLVKVKDKYAKMFGTVITDECHHISSRTFTETLVTFHARYYIGLSATLTRLDGKHVLFNNVFGDKVYTPVRSNIMEPRVEILNTNRYLTRDVAHVQKMNDLLYDVSYQEFIAGLALIKMQLGYKVLVTASRIEFLNEVYRLIGEENTVLITGSSADSKTQAQRERLLDQITSGEKHCVVASRSIFSEGISLNALSCLILAEPSGNPSILTQLIGRIMRQLPGKKQPVVMDIQFADSASRRTNNDRMKVYLESGWDIEYV